MPTGIRAEAPPVERLTRLYVDHGMTAHQIGVLYGVTNVTVLRWLRGYDIPVRSAFGGPPPAFVGRGAPRYPSVWAMAQGVSA